MRAREQRNRLPTLSDSELVCAGLRSREAAEERLENIIRTAEERLQALWVVADE